MNNILLSKGVREKIKEIIIYLNFLFSKYILILSRFVFLLSLINFLVIWPEYVKTYLPRVELVAPIIDRNTGSSVGYKLWIEANIIQLGGINMGITFIIKIMIKVTTYSNSLSIVVSNYVN